MIEPIPIRPVPVTPESEGRGPLPLYCWLHARAVHDRCEVGQQELADAFEVTVRTIYDWTLKLEHAGCLWMRRTGTGPAEYVLLRDLAGATAALLPIGTSTRRNSDLPLGFQSVPIDHALHARESVSSSSSSSQLEPPVGSTSPTALPIASGFSVSGFLTKLLREVPPATLRDRFEALDELRRAEVVVSMQAPDIRTPMRYFPHVLNTAEGHMLADALRGEEPAAAPAPPAAAAQSEPADDLVDMLANALAYGLRGAS